MDKIADEAVGEARAILSAIEEGTTPLSRIALRARRLAEMIDDEDSCYWLRLECEGALNLKRSPPPQNQEASHRGAIKFAQLRASTDWNSISMDEFAEAARQGKPLPTTWVTAAPLSSLESIAPMQLASQGERVDAGLEKMLREDPLFLINEIATRGERQWAEMKSNLVERERQQILKRVGSALHEWASTVYITHKFRQKAGNIFGAFKTKAEVMLAAVCPDALGKLNHATDRLSPSSSPEEWSAAALSCRRVLKDLADKLYPPSAARVEGRKVDDQAYKNRLWAFAREKGRQDSGLAEEIEFLCNSIDRLYDVSNKGVHSAVSREETELCVLRTYILSAQLAGLAGSANDDV